MSDQRPHNTNDERPSEFDVNELLRCAADDELTDDQRAAFERWIAANPEDRRRIDSEQWLRLAVGKAMAGDGAPAALRSRIEAMLADNPPVTETVGVPATKQRTFWAGAKRWSAVAAVLVVMVSVFIVLAPRAPINADGPLDLYGDVFRSTVIAHVDREHSRCMAPGAYLSRKLKISDLGEAQAFVADYFDFELPSLSLEHIGFKLAGIGRCGIPGGEQAVQAVYRQNGGDGASFSLFIQQVGDIPLIEIEENRCYTAPRADETSPPVNCWRSGGLIYYAISCDAEVTDAIREALGCHGVAQLSAK